MPLYLPDAMRIEFEVLAGNERFTKLARAVRVSHTESLLKLKSQGLR